MRKTKIPKSTRKSGSNKNKCHSVYCFVVQVAASSLSQPCWPKAKVRVRAKHVDLSCQRKLVFEAAFQKYGMGRLEAAHQDSDVWTLLENAKYSDCVVDSA